ncbi:MAG: FHA domain-containing protein [Myxococcales bacterium]|nr:FHA domain-containing protein [Myxococcales bacterium]
MIAQDDTTSTNAPLGWLVATPRDSPDDVLKIVAIGRQARIEIGRHPDCAICIADGRFARRHVAVTSDDAHVYVEDLRSHCGFYLNECRTSELRPELTDGDIVTIANMWFTFVTTDPATRRPPDDCRADGIDSPQGTPAPPHAPLAAAAHQGGQGGQAGQGFLRHAPLEADLRRGVAGAEAVYADWLTSQGHPLGTMIAIQLQQADLARGSDARTDLDRAQYHLWEQHERLLFGQLEVFERPRLYELELVDGLAERLDATQLSIDTLADFLRRPIACRLSALTAEVSGAREAEALIAAVAEHALQECLQSLELRATTTALPLVSALCRLGWPVLQRLVVVGTERSDAPSPAEIKAALAPLSHGSDTHFPALRHLDLRVPTWPVDLARLLAAAPLGSQVSQLVLEGLEIDDVAVPLANTDVMIVDESSVSQPYRMSFTPHRLAELFSDACERLDQLVGDALWFANHAGKDPAADPATARLMSLQARLDHVGRQPLPALVRVDPQLCSDLLLQLAAHVLETFFDARRRSDLEREIRTVEAVRIDEHGLVVFEGSAWG